MYSKRFEKETFKEAVRENVRTLYRKNIAEASPQQIFQAVSYAVKDIIKEKSYRLKYTFRISIGLVGQLA